jgi:hypothetical protein
MTARGSTVTPYRVLLFCATVWALTQILFLVDANFSRAKQFQESDYIMTFYIAGRLVAAGRAADLYPAENASSFIGAPFDKAAHELLDSLPEKTTAIYMYSPLVAWFFAPLSHIDANWSLLIWQAFSIAALAIACKFLAQSVRTNFSESLFLTSLFGPIFITLWSGQLGLVFGLLPLAAGFVLLLQGRPLASGFVWSLLLLKPQYFPAAAFVALVTALAGSFRPMLGIAIGTATIIGANLLLFSPALIAQWLASHRLSDTLFTHVQYGIPTHLITSLPADILLLLPASVRAAAKWPVYGTALLFWLIGIYYCWKIHRGTWEQRTKISLTLVLSCVLSSIALPHLLYYDLCVLIPAAFLLATKNSLVPNVIGTRALVALAWISISAYLPIFLSFKPGVVMALMLEIILLGFLVCLLSRISRAMKMPNAL